MTEAEARRLMDAAWSTRRAAFDMPEDERLRALGRARDDLTAAAGMLRDVGHEVTYAHAIHLLANLEVDAGDPELALKLWEEAVAVLRDTDDALQLAHKVRHLGDAHRHAGRLEEAETLYTEALALYREHDGAESLDFANAVRRMAGLRERQGDASGALDLWRETRALYATVGVATGVEEADSAIERLSGSGDGDSRR